MQLLYKDSKFKMAAYVERPIFTSIYRVFNHVQKRNILILISSLEKCANHAKEKKII